MKIENKPCRYSYQYSEPGNDSYNILNFLTILSVVILTKRILIKKEVYFVCREKRKSYSFAIQNEIFPKSFNEKII